MHPHWQKLGSVYCADGSNNWAQSHAYTPTPFLLNDDTIRLFVSFLDDKKVGRLGYIDLDAQNPNNIMSISQTPCLNTGKDGCFDDNGVTPISITKHNDQLRLYYIGWELSDKVRYKLFVGLAVSGDDGVTFQRYSNAPILDRCSEETTVRTAANVMKDQDIWRMWYIGGSDCIMVDGKQVPTYDMRYIESDDGIHWPGNGQVIMMPQGDDEYGFGRPYVCRKGTGEFEMWYSIRTKSEGYHIGYATSTDGKKWERQDHLAGIGKSKDGWDSEMVAFGAICDTKYGRYMFYNGNNFGETGVGVALWSGA